MYCFNNIGVKMNLKLFKMLFIIIFIASTSTFSYSENLPKYGVFLNISEDNLYKLYNYDIVVIDAQNFSKKAINVLKSKGITVYSYLNIGSIENFRPYYNNFKNIILKNYENWEEEYWIDISNLNAIIVYQQNSILVTHQKYVS